jgi:hypothetical protein
LANGAYGLRIGTIAERLDIPLSMLDFGELDPQGFPNWPGPWNWTRQ